MDNEIKTLASAELSKKELLEMVESKIAAGIAEISNGSINSSELQKKIKKAGKLISVELRLILKENEKKADQVKKKEEKNIKKGIKKAKS